MKRTRKILLVAATLLTLIPGAVLWLLGTESGTRWILGRATDYLPRELSIDDAGGSLLRGISLGSVEWHSDPTRVDARAVYLDFQLLPLLRKQVLIDQLTIGRIDVDIAASEEAPADERSLPAVELPVDVDVILLSVGPTQVRLHGTKHSIDSIVFTGNLQASDLLVSKFELRSSWLDLDVHGDVTLAESYPGSINTKWRWKESDKGPFAGTLNIDGDMDRYEVQHSLASPLPVETKGTISIGPETISADLLNEWNALEWPLGQQTVHSSRGTLHIRGNPNALTVDLRTQAGVDDQPESRIEFVGDVHIQPDISFDLEYKLADLSPTLLLDSVTGGLNLLGRVSGHITEQGPDVDLVVEQIDGTLNENPVKGKGNVHLAGGEISLANTYLAIGPNSISVDGDVGSSLSLRADVNATSIADVIPGATGSASGWVSLTGPRNNPNVQFELQGSVLGWQESLSSLGPIDATVSVAGKLDTHTIQADIRGLDSDLAIDMAGGFSAQTWAGKFMSLQIDNPVLGRWSTATSSDLLVSAAESEVSQTCLLAPARAGKVCFGGRVGIDEPATFDVAVTGVPLAALPAQLPEGMTLKGYLDVYLKGEHNDSLLTANAGIELHEAVINTVYQDEPLALVISKATGQAVVVNNRIDSSAELEFADGAGRAALRLVAQDVSNRQAEINGEADVSISDASFVAVFLPSISKPQGQVEGAMSIAGSMAAPELLGQLVLTDGSFGVRQSGISVEEINVELAQLSPGRLRLSGSALSGGGNISIDGETELGADTGIRTEIRIDGEDFELARLPDWQFAASPSVSVVFDDRIVSVAGELTIPRASIKLTQIPESAARVSSDAVVHREEQTEISRARRIVVDVDTTLGSDVQLSGFGLTTGLEGNVQIQGGSHRPFTGNGRLTLRDGRYTAYKQALEIERGELIFNGPLENPQLDIRAIRRANDVVAGILLSGTPTQLRSEVFSEPAMSDAEALSYLLTGRPLAGAASGGDGDVLNNAAFALGLSGAGLITSQIRNELGLETLTIEGGADDSRLIAGKRFGNRLLVEYGYGLVDKLGTLLLRYQLNERIVLESRTGSVSNLDVVYSVKKK